MTYHYEMNFITRYGRGRVVIPDEIVKNRTAAHYRSFPAYHYEWVPKTNSVEKTTKVRVRLPYSNNDFSFVVSAN